MAERGGGIGDPAVRAAGGERWPTAVDESGCGEQPRGTIESSLASFEVPILTQRTSSTES